MDLEFDKVDFFQKNLFIFGMQFALYCKKLEMNQEYFLEICKEYWKSMEMKDIRIFEETLAQIIREDMEKYLKSM